MVRDPVRLQKPMQPEAFATRFIATDHGRCCRQTQAAFGLGDFVEHVRLLPGAHSALTRFLTMTCGQAELPGFFTQFKGHKQGTLCYRILRMTGRYSRHWLAPPWGSIQVLDKKLTNNGPLIPSAGKHSIFYAPNLSGFLY